jgi:hypothetical protein
MEEDQNALAEAESGDSEDVENGGVGNGNAEEQGAPANQGNADKDDPYGVKKRLGMQAKKHQREMRQMQSQMLQLQQQMAGQPSDSTNTQVPHNPQNAYPSYGQPNGATMSEEEKIQRAVQLALGMKDQEQKQAMRAQQQAHVQKQYQNLNDEFDKASDKYDDFDDVVRGENVPFTPHVRDALLLVNNPADVAYRLGKNPSELERISQLHPLDQAREVNKLSFSLMNGGNGKNTSGANKSNPMGQIKGNPAISSGAVTGNTPPSTIRARMKAGTWK